MKYAEREKERRKSLVLRYVYEHPGADLAGTPHEISGLGFVRPSTVQGYIYELIAEGKLSVRAGALYPVQEAGEE